ncbi:MAG: type II toxin-antitoxin system PrlF family antitoxin [Pseudomonadota bacterium]|nr:type II toxin-antitoxin system PrlF family antitoxin [Pseudomonadota bacterium]
MSTITVKGQVTVPKPIRDALGLLPGSRVDFDLNEQGQVVLRRAGPQRKQPANRFEAARGKADIRWRTDELMALLRADDE